MKQHNNKKSTRLLAAALILTLLFGSLLSGCRKTEGTVPEYTLLRSKEEVIDKEELRKKPNGTD